MNWYIKRSTKLGWHHKYRWGWHQL